ncbi:hypothetical protein [Nonomuraea basaltis]|uniref:hypothetical protein n=1 Tax=Nonomuraea basaltis TaxID=2495887 RepID=UPI00110C5D7B|nr:hypothetical protein [Nonomuraea basaltis]TMS00210.1 hypothetical protein EJK15_03805 [Nonomuraea basaltis]
MGWGKERKKLAGSAAEIASQEAAKAREEKQKAEEYQKRLDSGQSTDRHADRYLARQHDSNRRVAAANAKDWGEAAEELRRPWWAPPKRGKR